MKNWLKWVIFISLILGLCACTGEGISGSASGGSLDYYVSDTGGQATGSFNTVRGTYGAEYEASIYNDDFVILTLTASVETGRLRVYIKDSDDTIQEVVLQPGESGSIEGRAEVWADETFKVYFEALDGEARQVRYSMEFRYE